MHADPVLLLLFGPLRQTNPCLSAHDAIAATVKDLRDEARVQPTPVDGVVADKIEVHPASQNGGILVLAQAHHLFL